MKLVYTHDNPALVGLAQSMLENAGIVSMVKNRFSAGGMTGAAGINQELWVDETDYDNAVEIIETMTEE